MSLAKKGLRLDLDHIENISDCDLDSAKNTSARAVTFNQFELTNNMMNPKGRNDEEDTENNITVELDSNPRSGKEKGVNASAI